MQNAKLCLLSFLLVFSSLANAEEPPVKPHEEFTGKITRDRVRMRLQPSLESPIIRELDRDELVLITGASDEFFSVKPPKDVQAYIYRSFVQDGVIHGNRVNVRLHPTLESPVIAQLNSGDKVVAEPSTENGKWMEIKLPENLQFYISKDYLVKVGDATFIVSADNRKNEVKTLLSQSTKTAETEMAKPFPDIHIDGVYANLNKVINNYEEFPKEVHAAKELLASLQENYLMKKVTYLESQQKTVSHNLEVKDTKLAEAKEELNKINRENSATDFYKDWLKTDHRAEVTSRMTVWIPAEISHYDQWAKEHDEGTIQEFYQQQAQSAVALKGVLEVYNRPIRNKPGDYVLINSSNNLPVAYLYSTQVNLEEKIGHEITVQAVSRPNNHFAYPAYFVLKAE